VLQRLVAASEVGLGLLVLLVLLVDNVFIGNLELLLLKTRIGWGCHLRHIECLEHGVEVEMIHI
jgi:hypothetical protein